MAAVGAVTAADYVSFEVVEKPPLHGFFDLQVYRGAVRGGCRASLVRVRDGPGLEGLHLSALPGSSWSVDLAARRAAAVLVLLASAAVAVLVTWWLVAPVARRHGTSPWFAVALAVRWSWRWSRSGRPSAEGQLNMLIFALVLADVVALRRGRAWCGVGIGLATALKLTPGLFLVFLVLIGRRRAALVAAGTWLAATLLGFAVDAGASGSTGRTRLGHVAGGPALNPWNQSVLGLLAHVSDPAPAGPAALGAARRRGRASSGCGARCGCTGAATIWPPSPSSG